MESTATIRDQLADYLSEQSMSINQFADRCGINSGTLSRIVKGNQPIAMSHLELITKGMGEVEDHFFSLYVDECFYYSAPTWRRLRPFMIRCAELGRMDCIERMVQILLDNLNNVPTLFEVSEGLFEQGQWQAAALLYKNVSASEKYQYSERLAVCQYRLFRIALGDDQSENLRAATLFEPYVPRLDEADQLDALKHLMNVYYSLHQWRKMDELAQELLRLAKIRYDLQYNSEGRFQKEKKPEKPLCLYILYAHLMRSIVYEECGDYNSALDLVPIYTDGSWIQEESEEVKRTLAQFQEWGRANTYLYRLLGGQSEVLPDYVDYISTRKGEIFTALSNVIKSANRYSWNVDHILERFSAYIPYRVHQTEFGEYSQQVIANQYASFLAELAEYYLHSQRKEGIYYILHSLEYSTKINNEAIVIRCVDLFEQYRHIAAEAEKAQYKLLIREVQNLYGKKNHNAVSFM
ncbi:helix-turn-helix transcriptional regulator [Paenibacillus graminis]|uniref:helix-turn-helix transcriptional regulator n=2 Tax=Paenibacillus graminis TaxID=189425 RepID=UPI002DBD7784|nr:helix-turn-helix transcriptional regulator [Paenibacillus graminis]MEC0169243.1 helix-turn-helix transcriptional regulator [Paenibacillus graminis]